MFGGTPQTFVDLNHGVIRWVHWVPQLVNSEIGPMKRFVLFWKRPCIIRTLCWSELGHEEDHEVHQATLQHRWISQVNWLARKTFVGLFITNKTSTSIKVVHPFYRCRVFTIHISSYRFVLFLKNTVAYSYRHACAGSVTFFLFSNEKSWPACLSLFTLRKPPETPPRTHPQAHENSGLVRNSKHTLCIIEFTWRTVAAMGPRKF